MLEVLKGLYKPLKRPLKALQALQALRAFEGF